MQKSKEGSHNKCNNEKNIYQVLLVRLILLTVTDIFYGAENAISAEILDLGSKHLKVAFGNKEHTKYEY